MMPTLQAEAIVGGGKRAADKLGCAIDYRKSLLRLSSAGVSSS